jgi:outer membrane protein TolC
MKVFVRPHRPDDVPFVSLGIALLFAIFAARPVFAADPLTLDEAYARAKKRSSEIKALEERIVEAEINVARAWALIKPQWNASFSYTHTEPRPPPYEFPALPDFANEDFRTACGADPVDLGDCIPAIIDVLEATGESDPLRFDFAREDTALFNTNVTWTIFNGRSIPLIKNAYDTVTLEKDRVAGDVRDLLLGVARAYYGAAATKQAIAAAERADQRAKHELAIAAQKQELGESVKSQLVAAQIAARQAAIDVKRAENAHAQALVLVALLTRSEGEVEVVSPPEPLRPEGDVLELTARALEKREDVHVAELAIVLADRTHDEAWWQFSPTLSVFGGYRWSNVAGISGQHEQWSVGLIAAAQLYDGGLRYEALRSADSRIRAASHALESARARVKSEVTRAVLRVDASAMSIERANDAVLLAKERQKLVASQYEVGAMRGLELAEANDAVLDAEIAIIRARMERALAVLELQRAVGAFTP